MRTDFGGSSSRGSVLRKETWGYGYAIPGLPTTDIVYDGSGNIAGQTTYQYDQTTPTPSSAVPQHISVTGPRGNLTTQTLYASSGISYPITNTYEDTGSLLTTVTPNGTTAYSYDSTFDYLTGVSLPTPSSGVALAYSETYDTSYTGLPLTSTDPNNQISKVVSYDEMLRPTQTSNPDGGKTVYSYESPNQIGIYVYLNSGNYGGSENNVRMGMRVQAAWPSKTVRALTPYYQQDTCYDANGNTAFVSYPYQGPGWTVAKVCSQVQETATHMTCLAVLPMFRVPTERIRPTLNGTRNAVHR